MSDLERTPFEQTISELLDQSVAGITPPASLRDAIRSRCEAPDAVAALAAVNTVAAPIGLRERVASAVTAAATIAPTPRPRFAPHHLALALGVVAAAAAALVYVAVDDDEAPRGGPTTVAAVAPGDDGDSDTLPPLPTPGVVPPPVPPLDSSTSTSSTTSEPPTTSDVSILPPLPPPPPPPSFTTTTFATPPATTSTTSTTIFTPPGTSSTTTTTATTSPPTTATTSPPTTATTAPPSSTSPPSTTSPPSSTSPPPTTVPPVVAVAVSGDSLSMVDDEVDYEITVTNTSSDDSPDLVNGRIVDTVLGNLLDPANPFVNDPTSTCASTLAAGASCTINATRTVVSTDPDPLPNTVTVHYQPDGFPNDVTDSDDHSVNLFQPAVEVEVDTAGDGQAKVDDAVGYTITVVNTSSADSPDLVNGTIIDSVLGDLLDPDNPFVNDSTSTCASTLVAGDSCTINATRTVESTDPDPLSNTVTVHYQPDGFPNDVTDSADHEVDLIADEGCGPGFWRTHPDLWDENSDAVSQNVKAAVDAKDELYVYNTAVDGVDDQLFRNIFGVTPEDMTAAQLDPDLTMAQGVGAGGGRFSALVRQGVAGLLNSATGIGYEYSTDQVLTMVHDAILSPEPDATADLLQDANELGCPLDGPATGGRAP